MRTLSVVLAIAALLVMNTESLAQVGFRIETDVFSKSQPQPVVQTRTFFMDGVAYDESREPGQDITIVDTKNDRIVRLRETKKLKCTTPISKLKEMLKLSQQETAANDRVAFLLASAKVVRDADNSVSVGSKPLTYAATWQTPPQTDQASDFVLWYRDYADASKLLDTFVLRGAPPYARLKLNETVMARGGVPEKIVLTIETGDEPQELTCNVHADWMLSKEDRQRVGEIQEMLITYSEVSVGDYAKATQPSK
ncbi:MAG: hypothetical protein AB8B50_03155 [Pirellulaceae bacterium]